MRKTIGFKIRDMWYNLGECFVPSDEAAIIVEFVELFAERLPVTQREQQDNISCCPVSQCVVVVFATLLDLSSVCREMKVQLIAFSNQTVIFLRDNVLLSLRPPQNEVHPSHGGAHSGGHAGAGARAEESHHAHLL